MATKTEAPKEEAPAEEPKEEVENKEGVFATQDIDWMNPKQWEHHLDNKKPAIGYSIIKAGEEITPDMIHGESGRKLVDVILEGCPDQVEVRGKEAEKKKDDAEARKKRWAEVRDKNKSEQVALLGELGFKGKIPRYENGRCDLIVALEFKEPLPEDESDPADTEAPKPDK